MLFVGASKLAEERKEERDEKCGRMTEAGGEEVNGRGTKVGCRKWRTEGKAKKERRERRRMEKE